MIHSIINRLFVLLVFVIFTARDICISGAGPSLGDGGEGGRSMVADSACRAVIEAGHKEDRDRDGYVIIKMEDVAVYHTYAAEK